MKQRIIYSNNNRAKPDHKDGIDNAVDYSDSRDCPVHVGRDSGTRVAGKSGKRPLKTPW